MECRKARTLADEYLNGALDEKARARVEAHLGTCGRCRSEFDEIRRYRDAAAGLPRVKVPDGFLSGIRDRLREEPGPRKRWGIFTRPLPKTLPFGAAAAAVAAFALIFVFHTQRPKVERLSERGAVDELQAPRREKKEAANTVRSIPPDAAPVDAARSKKTADASVPPAPAQEAGEIKAKSEPVEITLVLERLSPAAGTAPTREIAPAREAESAEKAVSARGAKPKRPGLPPDETKGESAGPALDKALDELASSVMHAGGRIVGTEPEGTPADGVLTVFAEIPALELAGLLERLEGLGRMQTDRRLSPPESATRNESVELRIRLTYRSEEDADSR
jgi:hypothetical protein